MAWHTVMPKMHDNIVFCNSMSLWKKSLFQGDQSGANNAAARNALEYLKIMVKKSNPSTQNIQGQNGATVDTNGKKVAGK